MPLQDYQVLQRDHDGKARVTLSDGSIVELETGGPYEIDGAREVYVGDLWILAGQSNMEGCGDIVDTESASPSVHLFGLGETWSVAEEPLHWLTDSPRDVHWQLWGHEGAPATLPPHDPNRPKGCGLGLTFAKRRHEATGVPIGLIASAHGGTSMAQWDPALKHLGGGSLYGATYERFKLVGGKVAGILWYQGESDTHPNEAPVYREKMRKLVAAFREDLGQPDLPFYFVQLGRFAVPDSPENIVGWNSVREDQRQFLHDAPNLGLASAIDLDLDDGIHIGTQALKRLGERLARVADGKPSPEVDSVTVDHNGPLRVRVSFKNVTGQLESAGRANGFSVRDASGAETARFWKTELKGNTVTLYTDGERFAEGSNLWYGWGIDPYCNITDSADMPIPAFGPISLSTE
jgi:sialate O-acetylesterase